MLVARIFLSATLALLLSITAFAAEDFSGQNLEKREFVDRNLEGANFSDAKLTLATFNNAILNGANFQEADLTSASFYDAQMVKADFRAAIITGTGLQRADLSEANFQGVDLGNVSFQNCKMKGANLRNAKRIGDCQKTDLRGADLRGAVFTCTVYYMTGCRLTGAKYDKNTRWPKGFDVEASGAVLTESDERAAPPAPPTDPKSAPAPRGGEARKAPNLEAEKLTEDVVKYLLETQLWGSKDGRGFTYEYKVLKFAASRKGNFRTDGIPANLDTFVTPVRVHVAITKDLGNNDSATEEKQQDFVFFKDEFGTWTYRLWGNK